jgi:acyl-CoA thioester hydrolase
MKEELALRVRFNETDSMRYLYHGNYACYYHACRTELLRKIGLCDKELELNGIILPVIELYSKYLKPAYYDDQLVVKTVLSRFSACKIFFEHEIFNEEEVIINRGSTVVAYVNKSTRQPIKIPEEVKQRLNFLTQ